METRPRRQPAETTRASQRPIDPQGTLARGRPPRQSLSAAPSGVDSAIRARIDNFLAEITELARASVVDAVRESGGHEPDREVIHDLTLVL